MEVWAWTWYWAAQFAVLVDPGCVVVFGSFCSCAVFAVALGFTSHVLVSALSFSVVLAGCNTGVVVVGCVLGDAELEG